MLPYSRWIAESVSELKMSEDLNDIRLVKWVELVQIAEETAETLGFGDASTSIELPASHLNLITRTFKKRMDRWIQECTPEVLNGT